MSRRTPAAPLPSAEVHADCICMACGCMCDDVDLTVAGGTITEAERACSRGRAWFLRSQDDNRPLCTIDGEPCSFEAAVARAAGILAGSHYPLFYGLEGATCEAQRAAVALADRLGAVIDTPASMRPGPTSTSFQGVAEVTCSLGEIASRADLVVFWGADPQTTHPRHLERYSLLPTSSNLPGGRRDRVAVLVDAGPNETASQVDHFYQIRPGADFEAFWVLRALLREDTLDANRVEQQTGVPLAHWAELSARMKGARYGALLFGAGVTDTGGRHLNVDAAYALVRDLNAYTRFVGSPIRGTSNEAGAENVLLWQTGYPFAVSFAAGYPRFSPGEYSAESLLLRGEPDAVVLVGSNPAAHLSAAALDQLAKRPSIAIGSSPSADLSSVSQNTTVQFFTARGGIDAPGTVYRMDNIPLTLRPVLPSSRPTDREVLAAIAERVPADNKAAVAV